MPVLMILMPSKIHPSTERDRIFGINGYFFSKLSEMKQLLAAFLLGSFFSASQAQEKLNVVFILTDDHRHDAMGFTGRIPWLETPYMDKMAKEGVWVKNATVTTALCSPSRASILTGQYAHTHAVPGSGH